MQVYSTAVPQIATLLGPTLRAPHSAEPAAFCLFRPGRHYTKVDVGLLQQTTEAEEATVVVYLYGGIGYCFTPTGSSQRMCKCLFLQNGNCRFREIKALW